MHGGSGLSKVAFLGLGVMGFPMAGHLKRAGHDVVVYNRTAAKATRLGRQARRRARADARARPPRTATSCSPASATTTICARSTLGDERRLRGMKAGAIFVDHTTASANVARELAEAAKRRGFGFVDAPVSGGQAGAENGQLTIMCGGAEERLREDRADRRGLRQILPPHGRGRAPGN